MANWARTSSRAGASRKAGASSRARASKVLICLIASMTVGAVVLIALDKQSLSAGAFSLASYTRLSPIKEVAQKPDQIRSQNWNGIEISYSGTASGDIEQLSGAKNLASKDINFHFGVCNGIGGVDGKIQAADRWQKQRLCWREQTLAQTVGSTVIRVCVIADGVRTLPTENQIRRTTALVEMLSRKFDIPAGKIRYPSNWQL